MRTFADIVCTIFNIPQSEVRDNLSSKDIPEWDSMTYLLCIAELEKEVGISFSMDDVLQVKTLGDLRALVEAYQKT